MITHILTDLYHNKVNQKVEKIYISHMGDGGVINAPLPVFGTKSYCYDKNILYRNFNTKYHGFIDIFVKKITIGTEFHIFDIWGPEKLWSYFKNFRT